ncbi:MAG: adenylate/guanylate cyclase domain-containing protein, partial [bacterium]
MECPACKLDNREGHRFCSQCGVALPAACPACGFSNDGGNLFCGGCGADVSQAAPSSTPPPSPSSPAPAEGERRQATVVFSDLTGYTAMNERLDPEEVEHLMSRLKAEAVRIVESHGGIVNQFVGDEVVALFGIPTAHEDDPRRAVQAALDVHDMARRIGEEVEARIGAPVRMHTGINSGLVVTHLRDDRDGRYGITGDTVNTGARLATQAEADTILLSPETQRLVAAYFETEALDAVRVKGKAEAVTPHRVLGGTQVHSRFEAAQQRGLSPHVGRERELDILRSLFAQAEAGQGQAVSVVGEAGLGKSRLIYEFRQGLDTAAVNLVIGRCTSTGEQHSYFPFQDLIRRWFGITDEDAPAGMTAKIEAGLLALDSSLLEHLPALLHLLAIPGDHAFPPQMAGEAIQRKIVAALRACLLAASRDLPLVLICEDLHWVDANSEAMLQQYIEALPARKVLLLLSYRPEYRPPWSHYEHLTPLPLRPLGEQDTAAIMSASFGVKTLPEGLAERVHRRTDGSPFFAEEVALSLIEEGVVQRDNGNAVLTRSVMEIAFPDTVQAVVRARIDRLPNAPREVLLLASVVGREFTESLVAKLSERPDPVTKHLGELKTLELILEKGFDPELEYMFKHAITREVSYSTLLVRRRKALHKLVGLAIEELYAERLPEFYEMLAHHFDQGEVWDKAVEYGVRAAMKARRNFNLKAAMIYYDRA